MGQAHTKKTKNKNKNKKELKFESKEKYFIQNGAIILQKQIALSQGQDTGASQLKIFSVKDIEKATNCYDPYLILGRSHATIYKGDLDDRVVAIKASEKLESSPELLDLFFTETSTGMVMNHHNMVTLYGCCLETYVPILVYEFYGKGSLFNHLHGGIAISKSLKWTDRLRVATGVAYALSYMHNSLSKPVVHRDVQSSVILLDKSQRWPVQGTPGYIDPEYVETQEVTDKCDVYSFGVLMLELLTGRQPVVMARDGLDLVDVFVAAVQNNSVLEMIDGEAFEQERKDEIERFSRLALTCVANKGAERPTMIEVVSDLWLIQGDRDSK